MGYIKLHLEHVSMVVSFFALLVSVGAIREARRRNRREDADLVHSIVANFRHRFEHDESGNEMGYVDAEAYVINGSPRPIFEVSIELFDWHWQTNPRRIVGRMIHAMSPHSQSSSIDFSGLLTPQVSGLAVPPIQILFRTSRHKWRREPDGQLYRWLPPRRWWRGNGKWRKD